MKPGDDTSGLGRWCWITLRRKENHFLRVVSVHRPCKADGHLTMYQQQVRWLSKQGRNTCPKQQIIDNCKAQVETWQLEGDTVIILGDINEDIQEERISTMFQHLGLSEVIITQHGTHRPNTHNHRQNPVDRIFLPNWLIQEVQSGYLAFREGIPSDHWAVWVDLPLAALGWFTTTESVPPRTRRLKCNNPCIIHRYNEALQEQLLVHQLPRCIETLTKQVRHNWLTRKQQWEYEEIDWLSSKAKKRQK